jgi:hypothetical protein
MRRRVTIALCFIVLFTTACDDHQRIDRLEKENQELKAKIDKGSTSVDYDLQAKCSRDAKVWFNQNWERDKDTVLLDYTNHYNKSTNSCFISIEYHYNANPVVKTQSEWVNNISLWNVYENDKIGEFTQDHVLDFSLSPDKSTNDILTCWVDANKCSSLNQYEANIRPYMSN